MTVLRREVTMNVKVILIVTGLIIVAGTLVASRRTARQKEGAERDRLERLVQEDRRQKEEASALARRRTEELLAVVRPLLSQCQPVSDLRGIRVCGKVWVWDETTGSLSGAGPKLPADLRGEPGDADLTVFVVTNSSRVQVATYQDILFRGKESPGYRRDLEVCAIDLATKQPLGKVTVRGSDPPKEVKRAFDSAPKPVDGETDEALAHWIIWRPRLGRPDRVGDALQLVPECRRLRAETALRVRSRVLIWDRESDLPDRATERLPDERRGRPEDADLTVVVVTGRRFQYLGDVGDMHLFREKLEVCVIDVARNEAVGVTTVDGAYYEEPRDKEKEKEKGIFALRARWVGDRDEALAKSVADLPRGGPP